MFPGIAYCAVAAVTTNITRTLSDEQYYGGCMAEVDTNLGSAGLACSSNWVSFSCTGDFTTSDTAHRAFDMAQIALVSGARTRVYVDDSRKHNGACFAYRLFLYPPE
jgi:hypothetical protein